MDIGMDIGMDEEQVAITSRKIATSAEEVDILHTSTKAALDDSGSGHVGSSAQALSELSGRWAAAGRRHTERIDTFGRNVGDAGVRMADVNEENARRLRDVPGS